MTDQKITMDGKWAYRRDPFTRVRVLCVDAEGLHPVVSLSHDHGALFHHADGVQRNSQRFDLVPLKVKREPREVWVVEHIVAPFGLINDCFGSAYTDETTARRRAGNAATGTTGEVIQFREVIKDE